MRLMRLGAPGEEIPVVHADGYFDLRSLTADIDGTFLADHGADRVRDALEAGTLAPIAADGLRVGAPIARPSALLCIGMNYAAHAAESGAAPPEHPVLFYKSPNTVVGPYDDVLLPCGSAKTDWEIELAVVIGSKASYLESPSEAASVIAGYTISNDVSERAFQLELSGGQWSKGKSCPTFNPLGPWLATPDEIDDPNALHLSTRVNGALRQDSSTKDMIFDVPFLIWHLSQFLALEPGDIVNTGTPAGVALSGRYPYLRDGDVIELAIEGLGGQRQTCRGQAEAPLR